MKEVWKETKREVVDRHCVYVASDGTEFDNKEICENYEDSALGVLFGRLKEFTIAEDVYYEADDGSDNKYNCIVPKSQEHLDVMNQIEVLLTPNKVNKLPIYTKLNVPYLVGYRFYGEKFDWVWFYDMNKIIQDITKGQFEVEHI